MPCRYTSGQELPPRVRRRLPGIVHLTSRSRLRPRAVVLSAVVLVATAAGCAVAQAGPGTVASGVGSAAPPVSGSDPAGARLALVVDDVQVATVRLADSQAGRDLAARLPVTLEMEDRFGQAVVGRLPHELAYVDVGLVRDPAAGHVYYSPSDSAIAVLTADLGPSVPAPGLVDLGVVDGGLEALAFAGNRFDLDIAPAD
jgi:hypothetical protein